MNIIKFKDVILDESSNLSAEEISIFNQYMRGRYVYCINWKYCVPMEEVSLTDYIELSQALSNAVSEIIPAPEKDISIFPLSFPLQFASGPIMVSDGEPQVTTTYPDADSILEGIHYILFENINRYIDANESDRANDVTKYLALNNFTPSTITTEMLKKFRTWIATTILSFNTITDYETVHMLTYYKNGMYDDVVKALTAFGGQNIKPSVTQSACGCNNNPVVQITGISACDPLAAYRLNIYNKMVEVFGEMAFWQDFDPEFLSMFKTYIDNILSHGFVLTPSEYISDFADCTCRLDANNGQLIQQERLRKLSSALEMIISGNTKGHSTYISNAFTDWAKYLYERMEW